LGVESVWSGVPIFRIILSTPPSKVKTFSIETFGCKVNQYDSQLIRESLFVRGYREVKRSETHADICIVNTCAVTHRSVAKSRRAVKMAARHHPGAMVIVTGCCADSEVDTFSAIPGVSHLIRNEQKTGICGLIDGERGGGARFIRSFAGHSRAFVKVQDGCDFNCAYCIVPRVRGRSRSRSPEEVVEEARALVAGGYREIVLSGIHLGMYGKDRGDSRALITLVGVLERIDGLERIRLSSIEPREVSDDLVKIMASGGPLCPHLHIPLQSGDEKVLATMRRNYTPFYYRDLVEKIRDRIRDVSLTTDVMIGFPSESEDAFENTLAMVRHCGFSRVHIFTFSPRPGTEAWNMGDPVPTKTKVRRRGVLEVAARRSSHVYRKRFVGRTVEVLILGKGDTDGDGYYGITREYLPAYFKRGDFVAGRLYLGDVEGLREEGLSCKKR
jgi:threonylcarbamoyladenosine tRNA methylthiotransferase MtaB